MKNRILFISIHPDDETLGCGGTILKHSTDGHEIHWIIITQPIEPIWSKGVIKRKLEEVKSVAHSYGMSSYKRLGFPANQLGEVPFDSIVDSLRRSITDIGPKTIYLVNGQDIHTDHQLGFQAAMVVLKPFYMLKLGVNRILSYETLSSTEAAPPISGKGFVPNLFSDITPYIDRKIEIMQIYASEIQPEPLPRSPSAIHALARFRGATIGVPFAEAFTVIREIS